MTDNLLIVAQQVAILFVLIGAGAAMRRLKLVSDGAIEGLVNLLILVVTPCLIVDVFQRPFDPSMLKGLGLAFLLGTFGHLLVIALALLSVRHRDENVRRPLLLAAVFSNAGFMGIPLEQAILGDEGVFFGVVYVVVFNLFMWSWGIRTMCGGGSWGSLKMWVNPGTVGIALGLPLFFCSVKLPPVIGSPIHQLANLNTPVAMVVIGYCLVGAKLGRVATMAPVYVATAIRLAAYPLAMVGLLFLLREKLDRNMMLAVVIAAAAPVAAMVSMFASKFRRDVDVAVAVVSGSTIVSIVTLPLVIALAMEIL